MISQLFTFCQKAIGSAKYIWQQVKRRNEVDDASLNSVRATTVLRRPKKACIRITTEAYDYLHYLGTKYLIWTASENLLLRLCGRKWPKSEWVYLQCHDHLHRTPLPIFRGIQPVRYWWMWWCLNNSWSEASGVLPTGLRIGEDREFWELATGTTWLAMKA